MTRPGGRSARVRDAVHDAVVELLAAGEIDAAIPKIAERAGVNPTSIYRRWGSREALLLDAAVTRLRSTSPIPDTGSLRGDLLGWAEGVEHAMRDRHGQILLRALVATMGPAEQPVEYLRARGEDLQAALDRAEGRGEPVPTVDEVLDFVLAPLYLRVLFRRPIGPGTAAGLVDRLFTALRAGPAPRAGRGG
ncbi:TetR/AcrR family transcriptional regulator [Amycolatopsis rifamycinica]|uniref:TetR family transcriptional regulator n=1 Tax=Amycolatopsis rifamycinica TaxID=287986 RepID=A0A066TX47_9PSEU|nr:TetR/AcrR family transcriptional regulator [Amycolatopsis rifamycinica]KDN16563.1 TetR family transcriptional regulator [Amycolatopsis rifamycinica]